MEKITIIRITASNSRGNAIRITVRITPIVFSTKSPIYKVYSIQ